MMNRYIYVSFAVLAVLAAAVSCSLAEVNEHNDAQSMVNVIMDWSQVGDSHPESMHVLASHTERRLIMDCMYPAEPAMWPGGDYMFLTFNGRDDIQVKNADNPKLLCLSLPISDSKYVGDAGEIYADAALRTVGPGDETEVVLAPRSLVQNLIVRFSLEVADDIDVSGVTAGLSGLVGSVYPFSGYVNYDDLYEGILSVSLVDAADGIYRYEARGRILGLFPDEDGDVTEGDGILNIEVTSDSYRGQKVFCAGINLMNTITAKNPMVYDEKTGGYVLADGDIVLDIACVLDISGDGMTGDANDGVDEWFMKENIDVEL